MASKRVAAKKAPIGPATLLMKSLTIRPFCDHRDVGELSPEEQAALHAFLHEFLAAYYRMLMVVPFGSAQKVLNKRFRDAKKDR